MSPAEEAASLAECQAYALVMEAESPATPQAVWRHRLRVWRRARRTWEKASRALGRAQERTAIQDERAWWEEFADRHAGPEQRSFNL